MRRESLFLERFVRARANLWMKCLARGLQPCFAKPNRVRAWHEKKAAQSAAFFQQAYECNLTNYCSPITETVMVTVTSVCSATCSGYSPTCLSGPCGMRTCERSTSCPCFSRASTMS